MLPAFNVACRSEVLYSRHVDESGYRIQRWTTLIPMGTNQALLFGCWGIIMRLWSVLAAFCVKWGLLSGRRSASNRNCNVVSRLAGHRQRCQWTRVPFQTNAFPSGSWLSKTRHPPSALFLWSKRSRAKREGKKKKKRKKQGAGGCQAPFRSEVFFWDFYPFFFRRIIYWWK